MERYELANGNVFEIRHAYGHSEPDDYIVWEIHQGENPFLAFQGRSYKDCRRYVERKIEEARAMR